ncbi:putative ribonuclease H-like domain-containing protein [Tanacetum coccineum]
MKRSLSSTSTSQNLAFLSSENTSSTNEVSTTSGDFGVSIAGGINQFPSTPCAHDVAYSFLVQPTTSPQLENEDFQQMDGDDLEELDLRWQVAMLTIRVKKFIQRIGRNLDFKEKQPVSLDKSKIKCYNCHRKGHFARKCRSGRNQGRRSYGDNGRSNAPTNESSSQALVAQDGLGGYDWSNDFEVEPVNYALMAISSSSSSSSSDSEVQKCSKQCLESFKTLQKNYDTEREKHNKAKLEIRGYEIALESLESRILGHEKNELAWGKKYEFQNYELTCREIKINNLHLELEKVVKERDELKAKIAKWKESTKNLDEILNSQMSVRDKTGLGYGTQLNELSSNHESDSENSLSVLMSDLVMMSPHQLITGFDEYAIRNKIIESQTTELNTKTSETAGKTNDANTENPKSASESVVSNSKINKDRVIIKDWNSRDEEEVYEVQTVRHETQIVKTRDDKSGQTSQKQGISFKKIKAFFVCKITDHLIKACNFHDKKSQEPKLKNVVNTGQREGKPVWDNTKKINHQNFSKYPHLSKTFVPSGVLTRTGFVSTARLVCNVRPSVSTASPSISTARPVSTARPSVSTARPVCTAKPSVSTARPISNARPSVSTARLVYATRFIYPRMDNVRPRGSCSPIKRSYYIKRAFRPKDLKQDFKTFGVQNMTTTRTKAVVNTSKVDHSCSRRAIQRSYYEDFNRGFVAFGSDPKGGKITGKCKIKTANLDFDDVYELKFNLFSISQMCGKKNSVLFTKSECLILSPRFKPLDENQVVLRAPRKDDVYSLDLKNIVPSGGVTCLYANTTIDESKLWHRRLGHVNFKNINKLVKGHLVSGLPSKVFMNDHTCVACKKGKQHKASCKAKLERIIRKPLELLHMDLFGPVSVESINKKRYCLVVTDDFSRFSWVFFLATKDETSEILCKFIIGLENQLNHNVKIIRCDNGTEFKNHAMNEFCAKKGIKREFSVARTPQQNGVAERKNRTLIEAARTMLADSLLPIPFWAEAVNTACYVLNRVLVTKPQNKTPYELLIGNSPSISFMRPFGCPLTILNTLDSFGKFNGKSNEGYLLGYSTSSKAFRVYNKRTKRVEENLHINFLEGQPNVTGTGPNWMFDLDFLTNSMNYIPVSVENQVNVDAGTQDSYVVGSSGKDKGPTQEYILLPLQPHRTRIPVEDVAPAAHEKPSESSPKDNDATSTNKLSTVRSYVSTATTPFISVASTPTGANAGESSFVYLGGQIPIDVSTLPNADLRTDPNMPDLEDVSNTFPNDGIFSGAYDDDDMGAEADFNNMDNTIDVSPIPILRVYKGHPKSQILGDPKSAVQTRGKIQKASSVQ